MNLIKIIDSLPVRKVEAEKTLSTLIRRYRGYASSLAREIRRKYFFLSNTGYPFVSSEQPTAGKERKA